ncbi:MAG: nucleotidyltransferase domain-containing protein [Candidatus Glassbacteria bacterium]
MIQPVIENDKWLKKYYKEVVPEITKSFSPCRIILFGSRAKGSAKEESDIDVILISDHFNGIKFVKRMSLVLKKTGFPKHVDYLCYTPEEVTRVKETSFILQEALEEGIEL